ncbi:peptidoglycan-binding domain-containing protein [Salinibacterium sp. ZJ450]|uniref:peptidoglycan-binding domain-containing protein n=1 Tax=Salinibacterium sp. ZJ450 TaxID=2708338 RepID=UPI001422F1F5|nr:peptidoglycan-binding domain-containing protein [Salinibacterium sp. ZJ450]
MSRRVWLTAFGVATTGVLVAGGWFAAQAFTSPAQWEAQAMPPAVEPVLAEVQRGDLIATRTLPGVIAAQTEESVMLAAVTDAARSVVTDSPLSPGESLAAGALAAWVNGSPVFAIASPFPFYRDLGVGDAGPDVRVLQDNLTHLGLLSGADGKFGQATAKAVAKLYLGVGGAAPHRTLDIATPAPETTTTTITEAPIAPALAPAPASEHPYLPLSAVAAFTSLPAQIVAVPPVGADVTAGASIGVVSTRNVVRVGVTPDAASALLLGAAVTFTVAGQPAVAGVVDRVFEATADEVGVGAGGEPMKWADILPAGEDELAAVGTAVSVVVETRQIAAGALLVPTVAVAQHDGTDGIVLRREDDGTFLEVPVSVLGSDGGRSAVAGELQPGDRVRVD